MFKFFKKKEIKKQTDESITSLNHLMDAGIADIWSIVDKNDFIIAMHNWICKKCNCGEQIDTLSQQERIFFVVQQLEAEVNNGGFSQYFNNSSGDFSNEIVPAFVAIGAEQTADICKTAITALNGDIPLSRDERNAFLDQTMTDAIKGILEECDNEFYIYADDLTELNYKFVMDNKAHFN